MTFSKIGLDGSFGFLLFLNNEVPPIMENISHFRDVSGKVDQS